MNAAARWIWVAMCCGMCASSARLLAQPAASPGLEVGGPEAAGPASAPTAAVESSATLRNGRGQQMGVIAVSKDGVSVGELVAGVTSARMISWHQVKSINGTLMANATPYLANADAVWRGLARLDRGDTLGAERVLEPLAKAFEHRGGPTAAAVHAGLLRCRLGRGAQTLAIDSWVAWLGANEIAPDAGGGPAASAWDHGEDMLVGLIDPSTGLATALPPVWLNIPAVRSLAGSEAQAGEPGPSRGDQMRDLYVQAARFECQLPTRLRPMDTAWSESQRLVWQVVAARIGDETTRKEARAALQGRLRVTIPAWQEAWCRVGVGRSLILEADDDSKREGLLQLLALAAREDGSDVYLTGVALSEAAAALRSRGDVDGAGNVLADLVRLYPDHPAMEWDVIKPFLRSTSGLTKRRGSEQPTDKRSEGDKAGEEIKQ